MDIISDIDIKHGIEEIQKMFPQSFVDIKVIQVKYQMEEAVYVNRVHEKVVIRYHEKHQVFLALKALMIHGNDFESTIKARISDLSYMVDCARGAVPKISTLKQLVVNLSLLGYRKLGLYVEDVLVLPDEEMFGYMRGAYHSEEINELITYAQAFGIKVVPYIQTLAHLPHIFKHQVYQEICDVKDILCVGENKTYALIEKMIVSAKDMFQTHEINIGMDEAWQLGLGKYLKQHGYKDRLNIMMHHLKQVGDILEKHMMKASMWADMFFLLKDGTYLLDQHTDFNDIKSEVPQHIKLIYWDYYQKDKRKYIQKIQSLKTLSQHIGFAGGAWKWLGYAPLNAFSIETITASFKVCVEEKIDQYILTAWGDNGAEASLFSMMPTLVALSDLNYDSSHKVNETLTLLTNYDLSEWLLLDQINHLYKSDVLYPVNPSKYLLFEDVLMGHPKIYVDQSYEIYYTKLLEKLNTLTNKTSTYQYIFQTLNDLVHVLVYKSSLSIYIYKAYHQKHSRMSIINKIDEVEQRIKVFMQSFKEQWYLENKRFGYEVHSYRLGGLLNRLNEVRDILLANDRIEELELRIITKRQPDDPREGCLYFNQFDNYYTF